MLSFVTFQIKILIQFAHLQLFYLIYFRCTFNSPTGRMDWLVSSWYVFIDVRSLCMLLRFICVCPFFFVCIDDSFEFKYIYIQNILLEKKNNLLTNAVSLLNMERRRIHFDMVEKAFDACVNENDELTVKEKWYSF